MSNVWAMVFGFVLGGVVVGFAGWYWFRDRLKKGQAMPLPPLPEETP